MEFDVFEVLLCHGQHIARVGKEYITAILVFCHVLIFAFLEIVKFGSIITLYPASLVQVDRFPTALCIVFVLKTVLYNLKLQLAHSAHDASSIELVDKELCDTLIHELFQSLLELLSLHWVIILDILEHLW